MKKFKVRRSPEGVWLTDGGRYESVARAVAVDAMRALGLDPNDYRTRDKIIAGIHVRLEGSLDYLDQQIPKDTSTENP